MTTVWTIVWWLVILISLILCFATRTIGVLNGIIALVMIGLYMVIDWQTYKKETL